MGSHDDVVLDWCIANVDAEISSELLWQLGAVAIEEQSRGADVVLVAGFESRAQLMTALRECEGSTLRDVDIDWRDAWKTHVVSYTIADAITVVPAWCPEPMGAASRIMVIDPGESFGLAHATTQLCIEILCEVVETGNQVLDIGCGSGVLSIAAVQLGAGAVTAIDINPQAIIDTNRNSVRNGVESRVAASVDGIRDLFETFDVVVANLGGAQVLISMADDLRRVTKPRGRIVLGGLLDSNVEAGLSAYSWASEVARVRRDGWNVIVLQLPL